MISYLKKFRNLSSSVRFELVGVFFLILIVFLLYVKTLVPSVLDGDQGEFQYMPAVLGIPHPPGFPLYLVLGHIWSWLPIGDLAYRMNLFSAMSSSLAIGLMFSLLRRQGINLFAAIGSCLMLAVVPPFWRYSTIAAVYSLQIFLSLLLFSFMAEWDRTNQRKWIILSFLVFGLGIANHPTFLLFAPGIVVFVLVGKRFSRSLLRPYLIGIGLFALVASLYLYFPLRSWQLTTNQSILPNWPLEVAQGIVSPFYQQGLHGLLRYLTGIDFTQNLGSAWLWDTFLSDLMRILLKSTNPALLVMTVIGFLAMLNRRRNFAFFLIIVCATFIFMAFRYEYGLEAVGDFAPYFEAYLLSVYIAGAIGVAWGIDQITRWLKVVWSQLGTRSTFFSFVLTLGIALFCGVNWMDLEARHESEMVAKSQDLVAKWKSIHRYAPEKDAALVSHWGDLTPLWYYQNAEGWRRDIVTIYPPVDGQVDGWLATGKAVYLAGPLLDWAPGIASKKYLTPWGQLVRVSNQKIVPLSPLAHSISLTFQEDNPKVRLLGYEIETDQVQPGDRIEIAAFWQIVDSIPLENYLVYFAFSQMLDTTKSEGDVLAINWLPGGRLVAGQYALGVYRYQVPSNLGEGEYSLEMYLYSINSARNLAISEMGENEFMLNIGTMQVKPTH